MSYYIGLDISLEATFIHVLDEAGKSVHTGSVSSEGELIGKYLGELGYKEGSTLAIESGQLSISLCKSLRGQGFNVICVDARHMARILSSQINKNDKNDARGIATMLRAGVYKEVKIKEDSNCELKVLLGSRRQLVSSRQQLMGTIRGLLKIYGIKLGAGSAKLVKSVEAAIIGLPSMVKESIKALLTGLESIEQSLAKTTELVSEHTKADADSKLLMTIPGVGQITAITYISSLDEAGRFSNSEDVGAYMGLTPRQYASGEVDRHGSISKMGPKECRTMLYEAAQSLLLVSKKHSKLKAWGMRIMKKKGIKKAIVAVARKLSVIMHRMLIDRQEFVY